MRTNAAILKTLLVIGWALMVGQGLSASPKEKESLLRTPGMVIAGDNQYYLRAVLEYYLNKALISKFGIIYRSADPQNPMAGFDLKAVKAPANIKIADTTHNIMAISFDPADFTYEQKFPASDYKIRYRTCRFKIPETLADLTSGLTFRYYRFNASMKASMQAFGIASGDADSETEYIVIDYLQYKDCNCDGLPTIRYAVGLRTELKFTQLKSKVDFAGVGSMPNIAAQVQLGQTKVTFSMKSIGLTGPAVRSNIPSEMDFNVSTYREFQNAIEFLRRLEIDEQVDSTRLIVKPVMIPVLDDFRTDFESSLYDLVKEVRTLIKLRRRIKWKLGLRKVDQAAQYCDPKNSPATYNPVKCNYKMQLALIDSQINTYAQERAFSQKFDKAIGSLHRYAPLFELLQGSNDKSVQELKEIWKAAGERTRSLSQDPAPKQQDPAPKPQDPAPKPQDPAPKQDK